MRCFTLKSSQLGACPKLIMSVEHWREDGTCACDGRPLFEMGEHPIFVMIETEWVELNRWLTDCTKSYTSKSREGSQHHWLERMRSMPWPSDRDGVVDLCREISADQKHTLFRVLSAEGDVLFFKGVAVPSCR